MRFVETKHSIRKIVQGTHRFNKPKIDFPSRSCLIHREFLHLDNSLCSSCTFAQQRHHFLHLLHPNGRLCLPFEGYVMALKLLKLPDLGPRDRHGKYSGILAELLCGFIICYREELLKSCCFTAARFRMALVC